jgi:hypothetical protein
MWHLKAIPRTVHFYWGNDKLSFLRYLSVYSFKKFNPDWEIKFYYPQLRYQGEKTWDSFEHSVKFEAANYWERLMNLDIIKIEYDFSEVDPDNSIPENFKSDLLKWRLLSTVGGLWSDFDILYFKPMSCLHLNQAEHQLLDTLICLLEEKCRHSIGFLLSAPDNDFYAYLHQLANVSLNIHSYQSAGPDIIDTFPTLSSITDQFKNVNIGNIKRKTVYPLCFFYEGISTIYHSAALSYIDDDSIGIHWYGGHPESGEYENALTETNYKNYPNIISAIISRILA